MGNVDQPLGYSFPDATLRNDKIKLHCTSTKCRTSTFLKQEDSEGIAKYAITCMYYFYMYIISRALEFPCLYKHTYISTIYYITLNDFSHVFHDKTLLHNASTSTSVKLRFTCTIVSFLD